MGRDGFDEFEYSSAIEQLSRSFTRMEAALAQSEWLVDGQYTIADICLVPVFQRLADLDMSDLWTANCRASQIGSTG